MKLTNKHLILYSLCLLCLCMLVEYISVEYVPMQTKTVIVQPGQTLWEIAADNLPEGKGIQRYIYDIKTVNGMETSELQAYQRLEVPE